MNKRDEIKALVAGMLEDSHKHMLDQIDKVLNCGAIDVESWDPKDKPMILPKIITAALLQRESVQYLGRGTSYEKSVKKEIRNILWFI